MKKVILLFILVIALFLNPTSTQAGFLVKRKTDKVEAVTSATADTKHKLSEKAERRQEVVSTVLMFLGHGGHEPDGQSCNCCGSGWQGTAAMWCGIGGLTYFPPALICAVIFGALGVGPNCRHRKRAVAGLVMGITGLLLWGFLITLFATGL